MKFASSENVDVKKNIIIFIIISLILFFIDRSDNKYFKATRSAINDGIIYATVVLSLHLTLFQIQFLHLIISLLMKKLLPKINY